MLKIVLEILGVIGAIVLGVFVFIKVLPWVLGILAGLGVAIELYHRWVRSRNGGGAAPASC